jgi:hypothetical protein
MEDLRERYIGCVERKPVIDFTVDVAVLPGQDHCPGRTANGIGYTGIVEQHALVGNPVDVGCFYEMIRVGTDGLVRMIIRHDEKDIGWLFYRPGATGAQEDTADPDQQKVIDNFHDKLINTCWSRK